MSHSDDQAPATKLDIRLLMETIGDYYSKTEKRFGELEERMTLKMGELEGRMLLKMENMRQDLIDVKKDRLSSHEDRIIRLERKTGIVV